MANLAFTRRKPDAEFKDSPEYKQLLQTILEQSEQVQAIRSQAVAIQESFESARILSEKLKGSQGGIESQLSELKLRLEGFYGRVIEIVGMFIAIFSFIIAGIQIAAKADGTWLDKLGTSAAIFIPVTLCIAVLVGVIRWTSRR